MTNPYRRLPPSAFWKTAVADQAQAGVDPVVSAPFTISTRDKVCTAGSCFAQHISRTLAVRGFNYHVTERFSNAAGTEDENYGVFPARFSNIYTSRQLLQLFDRAYGLVRPQIDHLIGKRGEFLDPFRPRIQQQGFETLDMLQADRSRHLAAVREMFEACDVFIFTLGLTETWLTSDGFALPLPPGVPASDAHDGDATFHNLQVTDVIADMEAFLDKLWTVNPGAKVILTVSPVPLVATYEDRHVLVSTIASKSILRAAAEQVCRNKPQTVYFPSYEMITGPQTASRFFAPDLREVTDDGVKYVMAVFALHFLEASDSSSSDSDAAPGPDQVAKDQSDFADRAANSLSEDDIKRMQALNDVVCDELEIARL